MHRIASCRESSRSTRLFRKMNTGIKRTVNHFQSADMTGANTMETEILQRSCLRDRTPPPPPPPPRIKWIQTCGKMDGSLHHDIAHNVMYTVNLLGYTCTSISIYPRNFSYHYIFNATRYRHALKGLIHLATSKLRHNL